MAPLETDHWLNEGRRELHEQLAAIEHRLSTEFGKVVQWPALTEDVFYLVGSLGYLGGRKSLDYCMKHGHLRGVKKSGRNLLWSRDDLVEYAMQLERLRYWQIGRHDHKKTWWERQAEDDIRAPAYDDELLGRIHSLDLFGRIDLMATIDGPNAVNKRRHIANYVLISAWEQGRELDGTSQELLGQLAEEPGSVARQAIATTIKHRLQPQTPPTT